MKCHCRYQAKWPLFTLINKSHVFPFLHFFIPYFFSQNKAKSSADLHFLASRFPARGTCSSLIIIPNVFLNLLNAYSCFSYRLKSRGSISRSMTTLAGTYSFAPLRIGDSPAISVSRLLPQACPTDAAYDSVFLNILANVLNYVHSSSGLSRRA